MNIVKILFSKKEEVSYKNLIKEGAVILDVRSKDEFASGHIRGAINIPLDVLSSNFSQLGGKDAIIITCCLSGGRSAMAGNILRAAGYNHVHNGGGWKSLESLLQ